MIKKLDDIVEIAKSKGKRKIVVAGAEGKEIFEAFKMASEFAKGVFVGNQDVIEKTIDEIGLDDYEIVDSKNPLYDAVKIVSEGKAEVIMKGKVQTAEFLRMILDKQFNLRTGRKLSHITVMEIPTYHKLLFITDAGMNIRPDFEFKVDILKNALDVMRKLGYEEIKVALVSAIEMIHPDMPETFDFSVLCKMADRGVFGKVVIDGPLGFDIAISKKAAERKKIKSPVSGEVDLIMVPDIASGNIMAKALAFLGGAKIGGMIAGAKVPIVLLSRADEPEWKFYSLAFTLAVA